MKIQIAILLTFVLCFATALKGKVEDRLDQQKKSTFDMHEYEERLREEEEAINDGRYNYHGNSEGARNLQAEIPQTENEEDSLAQQWGDDEEAEPEPDLYDGENPWDNQPKTKGKRLWGT